MTLYITIFSLMIWILINSFILKHFNILNDFYKISIGHILTSFIPIFNIIFIIFYIVLFCLDREHIKCKILVPKNRLEKIIYLFWN